MGVPKSVANVAGTGVGYVIAAVLLIVLVLLVVALWHAAAGAAVRGGARDLRISMRPKPFAALVASGSAVIARPKRRPFDSLKAGDRVEVRRSRAPGDLTEYPGGAKAAVTATVTAVDDFADFTALVKSVGPAAFGHSTASAAVDDIASFYRDAKPPVSGPVCAIRLKSAA